MHCANAVTDAAHMLASLWDHSQPLTLLVIYGAEEHR